VTYAGHSLWGSPITLARMLSNPRQPPSRLEAPDLHRVVRDYARRRIDAQEVDDVVQSVFEAALASERLPEDDTELRRWLVGVARFKIADLYRRRGRERPTDALDQLESKGDSLEDRELMRWAERTALGSGPDAARTLQWMAREGDGEKLEHIAAEERLPAPTVRKRVSRMRRLIRDRWALELAAATALLVLLVYLLTRGSRTPEPPEAHPEPPKPDTSSRRDPNRERAIELRRQALEVRPTRPRRTLELLDEARALDPVGDSNPSVRALREDATRAMRALDTASPFDSASPDLSAVPSSAPVRSPGPAPRRPSPEPGKDKKFGIELDDEPEEKKK
jgi:RNA polymerase sigma factor (sigma-70 family)